jgi:LPXTG-motif cell wall-anchored protein
LKLNEDGTFIYIPDKNYNGQDSFTFKVNDGTEDSLSTKVDLTVIPTNDGPEAYDKSVTIGEDESLNGVVKGIDIDGDVLSYYLVSNPSHGSLTFNEDGSFSYTPYKDYNGQDSFTYIVNDGLEFSLPAKVNITIDPINDKPTAFGQSQIIDEDSSLTGIVSGTDIDGDILKYYVVTAPTHGSLKLNEDGTFTYTPNKDYNGEDSFSFKANDGDIDSAPATVNITVNPLNDGPSAFGESLNTGEDIALNGTVMGADIDGDSLKYYVVTAPTHGTLKLNEDGTFTYTPNKDYNGEDSFSFRSNDGDIDSAPAVVNITVKPVNDGPSAFGQSLNTDEDKVLSGTVTSSDIDGDSLKYYVVIAPTHGSLKLNEDGTFTYTPNKDYNGQDSFSFRSNDGDIDSAPATVNITVNPINDGPSAFGQSLNTDEDKVLNGTVTGSDIDGDSLKYYVVTAPTHGTLKLNEDGTFIYTPNKDYNGEDSFSFKSNDGDVDSALATVNITVKPVNDGPTVDSSYSKNTPYYKPVSGSVIGTDVDNDKLTYSISAFNKPTNGSVVINETTGQWTYSPKKGFSGNDSFMVVVSDGKGGTATTTIFIKVLNADPTVENYSRTTTMNKSVSDSIVGLDENNDELLYAIVSEPNNGSITLDSKSGRWSYTPKTGFSGNDSFKVSVSDGKGVTAVSNVNIIVDATLNLLGTVTDQTTGVILPGSTVELRDLSNNLVATVVSNNNGNYYFKNIKLGSYNLLVKNSKYSTQTLSVGVAKDKTSTDEVRVDARLVNFVISLNANPTTIIGDGIQTTTLTVKVIDKNNKPLANTEVTFNAPMGSFPNGSVVKTDSNGLAKVLYRSANIESVKSVSVPVTAVVEDKSRGLYASEKITINFEPGTLTGVVVDNTTKLPVKDAVIEVSKDFNNDGVIDFYTKLITGADGKYKIAIPKGGVTYDVSITKPVVIGNQTKMITFNQKSTVDSITGTGNESFTSDKTAAGLVLFKKPNGEDSLLKDYSNLSFDVYDSDDKLISSGVSTHIYNSANDKGVFSADGLEKGQEYKFAVKYTLPNGQKIIIGSMKVAMNQDGEINLSSALIDPYGTITDSISHKIITGVNVKLYYANTTRNILAGRKPGTLVDLPKVAEFPPADNANPQFSDDFGKYAYMVFPDADYYVVAAKDGYETYTSPVISVGKEIVKHDFSMNAKAAAEVIKQLPKTGSEVDMNGLVALGTILILSGLGLTLKPKRN